MCQEARVLEKVKAEAAAGSEEPRSLWGYGLRAQDAKSAQRGASRFGAIPATDLPFLRS